MPTGPASTAGVSDPGARTSLPLACTLGPEDGYARLQRWQALHRSAHPVSSLRDGVLEVRYPGHPGVLDEVRALATAERTCCTFVEWTVRQVGGDVLLTVRAPAGTPEAVDPIAALFTALT
jgi:hypothetical protein